MWLRLLWRRSRREVLLHRDGRQYIHNIHLYAYMDMCNYTLLSYLFYCRPLLPCFLSFSAFFIAFSKSSALNGLDINTCAPAFLAFSTLSALSYADTMIILTPGMIFPASKQTSKPRIPGIAISQIIRSTPVVLISRGLRHRHRLL